MAKKDGRLHEKGIHLRRHKLAIAYQHDENWKGFSDLTYGYWESATRLHKLAEIDAAKRPLGVSPIVPSVVALYCICADSLINSVLGQVQLFIPKDDLKESCYSVACESLSSDKVGKFAYLLQVPSLADSVFLNKFGIMSNLRGEVIHFVPIPSKRNEWRGRVLEAVRAAGVSKERINGLDWSAAMTFIEIARWCQALVFDLCDRIEAHFNWNSQLYTTEEAAELGARTLMDS